MLSQTLVSLAILKVNIDNGGHYLDYISPFVIQILVDNAMKRIEVDRIRRCLLSDYGLKIPDCTIQEVIKRIIKKYPSEIIRENGVYCIIKDLDDPLIGMKKANISRQIDSVISGLLVYSKRSTKPFASDEEAVNAICIYLSNFGISCLRAYVQGTTLPCAADDTGPDVVNVSKYVVHLLRTDPLLFGYFMILVQGHMLANSLLCQDLKDVSSTFRNVTFYFDTPLLIRRLGLEGEEKQEVTHDLMELLVQLGGNLAVFSHTRDELENVISSSATYLDRDDGRGSIIQEARLRGTSRSDLLMIAGRIDDSLAEMGIHIRSTPPYDMNFQIDEAVFSRSLGDELMYNNECAKDCDVNSVRSIYVLRGYTSPSTLERSKAVLVTCNSRFAQVAYEYGKKFESSRAVSSVISEYSLANMAWLKAPMKFPDLPKKEVIAFSYAALGPSEKLLNKFIVEIGKLEDKATITAKDHQLLRCNLNVRQELVHLTLGDDKALSEATAIEILQRVTDEIKEEQKVQYDEIIQERDHKQQVTEDQLNDTQRALEKARYANSLMIRNINDTSNRYADKWSKIVAWILRVIIVLSAYSGFFLTVPNGMINTVLKSFAWIFCSISIVSLIYGFSVRTSSRDFRLWLYQRKRIYLMRGLTDMEADTGDIPKNKS